jgi:hypothetical protein
MTGRKCLPESKIVKKKRLSPPKNERWEILAAAFAICQFFNAARPANNTATND